MIAAHSDASGPALTPRGASRGRLLLAWASALATLLLALAAGSLLATIWMLARTEWGRFDLGTGDAVFALALPASAAPAWTAWRWLRLWEEAALLDRWRARLTPAEGPEHARSNLDRRVRRIVWLALHPVGLPFWLWLTCALLVTATSAFTVLAVVPLTVSLLVALLAAVSLVMLLARPSLWPLHVWLAHASFGGRR